MFKHLSLTLLLAVFIFSAGTASGQKQDTPIYAFGYCTCIGDSVAYVSAIQVLPGAVLNKKTDFLENINLYSNEMERSMRSRYGKHFTAAVFFSDKKEKIEKKYVKLRKRIINNKKKGLRLVEMPATDFQFTQIVQQ